MGAIRSLGRLAVVAAGAAGLACGDDDPTGPGSVSFPDWPATIVAAFCVRGTAVVDETKSSTLADTDCDVAAFDPVNEGYFEAWRVRVASARDVTFDASSTFDNVLTVFRVNSVSATSVDIDVLGGNDDRSATSTNALVTVRLEPNVDYAVAVSGVFYEETGPYTLALR